MQIRMILARLNANYEHIVSVITASRQLNELDGVSSVLLDAEARQQDNQLQIGSNSVTLSTHATHGSNSAPIRTISLSTTYPSHQSSSYQATTSTDVYVHQGYPTLNSYG